MKKIYILIFTTIFVFILSGCSSPTTLKLHGVSRDEVANVLWKHGSKRIEHDISTGSRVKIWPDLVIGRGVQVWPNPPNIDKPKTVFNYRLEHFLETEYCKDTIYQREEGPNNLVVSLKCESKRVYMNFLWGILNLYERDIKLEKSIMLETAKELGTSRTNIEWKE